jgi:hypothetical protein
MDPGGMDWVLPEGCPEQRKRVVCNGLAIQFLSCKSRESISTMINLAQIEQREEPMDLTR